MRKTLFGIGGVILIVGLAASGSGSGPAGRSDGPQPGKAIGPGFGQVPHSYPLTGTGSFSSKWIRTYGEGSYHAECGCQAILPAGDGRVVLAGFDGSGGSGGSYTEVAVMQVRSSGAKDWRVTFNGGYGYSEARAIIPSADGRGYVVAGCADDSKFMTPTRALAMMLGLDGTVRWIRSYRDWTKALSLCSTPDGGYVLAGETEDSWCGWLAKVDATGKPVWQETLGPGNISSLSSVLATSDGGLIAAGMVGNSAGNEEKAWIVKLDGQGAIKWQKTYEDASTNVAGAASLASTRDGGYVLSGYSGEAGRQFLRDVWVCRLDGAGNVLWQKAFAFSSRNYDSGTFVLQTRDGGYLVTGSTGMLLGFVLKLDSAGGVQWLRTYGSSSWYTEVNSAFQTDSGGFVSAGRTENSRILVTSLGPDGTLGAACQLIKSASVETRATSAIAVAQYYFASSLPAAVQALSRQSPDFHPSVVTLCQHD